MQRDRGTVYSGMDVAMQIENFCFENRFVRMIQEGGFAKICSLKKINLYPFHIFIDSFVLLTRESIFVLDLTVYISWSIS